MNNPPAPYKLAARAPNISAGQIIIPRDFDLSPNFEIVKYHIMGLGRFDYQSMWADSLEDLVKKRTDS